MENPIACKFYLTGKNYRSAHFDLMVVYKIPYRHARTWPSGCLYTRYPIVARALGLAAA